MPGIRRAFAPVVLGLIVCGLAGALWVHVDVVRMRNKAEMLRSQVMALRPGKTTLSEVQELVRHAEKPYGYEGYSDSCDSGECLAVLGFMSYSFGHTTWSARALQVLGMKPVTYDALIHVVGGVVRRVEFSVFYEQPNRKFLSISTVIVDGFSRYDLQSTPSLNLHSEYALCSREETADRMHRLPVASFVAGVSSNAPAEQFYRALTLNLTCVTTIGGCSDVADLASLAYSDWRTDSQHLGNLGSQCDWRLIAGTYPPPWWAVGWRYKTQS